MKKTLLALVIASALSTPMVVRASGFPTFDAANLLQSITEYEQLISEYEQILQQTGLNTQQLLVAIDEYQQMLREYNVLLNQVTQLEDKIDRRDYEAIARQVNRAYEQRAGNEHVYSSPHMDNRYGALPDRDTSYRHVESTLGAVPSSYQRSYQLAADSHIQGEEAQQFAARNAQIKTNQDALDATRLTLGNETELATLQLLVEQNQVLIDQLDLQNDMTLSSYSNSNQMEHRTSAAILRAEQAQIERIEETKAQGVVEDTRPIR
ncbi:hypothetical protein AB4391_01515 [Vibrio lentus]|uniref:Conjugal transfer protein TrbJ n=1 Tax=Vibrio lentus TaxID=136468 RepID=A0A2N7KP18_9VIBR|nr:hypothetical protein [Vibrio lentus]PMM78445.1 hypothetical protein BCT49_00080 [Vibrio lentus]